MNGDTYLKIKAIRDKYEDVLQDKTCESVALTKQEFLALTNTALEREGIEVRFVGKVTKITPKEKADGDVIEVTLSTGFGASKLASIGNLFGESATVYLDPLPIVVTDGPPRHESKNIDPNDPEGKNLHLPFDGPTADPAPEEAHQAGAERIASTCPACGGTSYRGEGSEEACETCGGTGVVYSTPGESPNMIECPDCGGEGNLPDEDDALGPCITCHGTGKVEAEVTDDDQEVDDDLENEGRAMMAGIDPATGAPLEESAEQDPASIF